MQWKRYVLAFLVVAVVGLLARMYGRLIVLGLFGRGSFDDGSAQLMFLAPRLLLPLLVAAIAGYVLPKGFFLWGVAVISLHPLEEARETQQADAGGAFGPSGIGDSELFGLIFVLLMMLTLLAFVCTVASALGAGLRLLWWWIRGESIGGRLGVASGSRDAA